MDTNSQKEEFSLAYIRAVATVAGYHTSRPDFDRDSVDLSIAEVGAKGTTRSPRLDVQAKCTSRDLIHGGTINFPLEVGNYNDLRAPVMVPRLLIVVTVPEYVGDWLNQSEEELVLKHCGYWLSLRGLRATGNVANVTVSIPRSQIFTPPALQQMMLAIDKDGHL